MTLFYLKIPVLYKIFMLKIQKYLQDTLDKIHTQKDCAQTVLDLLDLTPWQRLCAAYEFGIAPKSML